MARYTRLETAAMAALAWDLRDRVPDLAGQFDDSRPSVRKNSGFGLFKEMVVARDRPPPRSGPTGDLGTVHVMVGSLRYPIAFRARFRNGVLLGLIGDSYGQDTRGVDFARVPFDCVFTVDASGRSIEFEPRMPESPLRDLHRHRDHLPPPSAPVRTLANVGPLQSLQAPMEVQRARHNPDPEAQPEPDAAPLPDMARVVLIGVGVYAAVSLFAVLALDVAPIVLIIIGGWLASFLFSKKGRPFLRRANRPPV